MTVTRKTCVETATNRMIDAPHQHGEEGLIRPKQFHFLMFHPEVFLFQFGETLAGAGQGHFDNTRTSVAPPDECELHRNANH